MGLEKPGVKAITVERRYDLDWLRFLAIIILFFYHSAKAFDTTFWHINNSVQDLGFTVFVGVASTWIMPLFFILSGFAIGYSLRKRRAGEFAKERVMRILVPYIFGIFVLLSVHVYYEALHWGFTGSYFEYYFYHYFTLERFPWHGIYLWYLRWLFIFSFIGLPLFIYFRKEEIREKILKATRIFNKRGAIYALAIPLILTEMATFAIGSDTLGFGGWQIPSYFFILFYGYLFASDPKSKEYIEKNVKIAVIIAPIATIMILFIYSAFFNFILWSLFLSFAGLSWLILILGLGSKKLNFNHERLKTLNEIVLPIYIIHQTVIVAVDYYVVALDAIVIVKFLLVVAIALPITLGLVMLVRTNNITRFLFGMRLKKKLASQ